MTIYTKEGDRGETNLFTKKRSKTKKRVSKDSLKIEVLGTIDELNSFLGITISFSNTPLISSYLKEVQKNFLAVGSIVAGKKLRFSVSEVRKLEKIIDKLEKELPSISNFILPGGTVTASHLHYARSLTRRCERVIVNLSRKERVNPQILAYINRLSDFLFILGRYDNFEAKVSEEIWPDERRK